MLFGQKDVMKADHLVLDGKNMLYRTSDAFKVLTTEVGGREIGCGGMYGFLSVAVRVWRRYGGKVWVAWEGRRSRNFRRDLYPAYKRKPEPDPDTLAFIIDMSEQERRLKAMLRAMGVAQYAGDNCEADDVMAWIATEATGKESVIIYTGDSDLRQLVDGQRVAVVSPGRKSPDVVYGTAEAVYDKHGVPPELLADLKALAGDSSDNIPGVRSVGPKTALQLINQYGEVEAVIEAASKPEKPHDWPVADRFQALIRDNADNIRTFKKLTGLQTSRDVKEIQAKRNKATLIRHFNAYRFRSLLVHSELMDLMAMGA